MILIGIEQDVDVDRALEIRASLEERLGEEVLLIFGATSLLRVDTSTNHSILLEEMEESELPLGDASSG